MALARVVGDFDTYFDSAHAQSGGHSYTTPTLRQFLEMHRQFRRLREGRGAHETGQSFRWNPDWNRWRWADADGAHPEPYAELLQRFGYASPAR